MNDECVDYNVAKFTIKHENVVDGGKAKGVNERSIIFKIIYYILA